MRPPSPDTARAVDMLLLAAAATTSMMASMSGAVAAPLDYDVVVYGSTPAGIAAATAAGTLGAKVGLFEPLPMIGGMGAAGNLALNDGGNGAEHTGLALNFTMLNGAYYNVSGQVSHPESFVSEASFRKMLATAGVQTIKTDCRLLSAATAKEGGASKIASVKLLCESQPVTAKVFIDASCECLPLCVFQSHMGYGALKLRVRECVAWQTTAKYWRRRVISTTQRGGRPRRSTTRASLAPVHRAGLASVHRKEWTLSGRTASF